jgi:ubiquinone biosynthesis protein UbiJ
MIHKKSAGHSNRNPDFDIQKRSLEAVPRWTLAVCAVLLVMSFAIRQIGLDITTPLNRIMSAYAARIESRMLPVQQEITQQFKQLESRVLRLERRVDRLEKALPSK